MVRLYTKDSKIFFRDSRKELLFYLGLWLLLFLTPLFSIYVRLSHMPSTAAFPWNELLMMWHKYAIFFVMFLVHNFLMAPLLVYRNRRVLYFSLLAVMLGVFLLMQCGSGPHGKMDLRGPHDKMELCGPDGHPAFAERPPHKPDGHDRFGEREDIDHLDGPDGLRDRKSVV